MKGKYSIYSVVTIGLLGALVFVSNYLSFPIPVPVGDISRIHLGNVFCLLSGFVMGPIGGGLASGIGAMLYDLTNPAYVASAPFTFLFKFLLAFVCGIIAHRGKISGNMLAPMELKTARAFIAAIAGSVTYIVLYLAKSYITAILAGSAAEAAALSLVTKLAASSVNAVLAVIISVPLAAVIRKALKSAGLSGR